MPSLIIRVILLFLYLSKKDFVFQNVSSAPSDGVYTTDPDFHIRANAAETLARVYSGVYGNSDNTDSWPNASVIDALRERLRNDSEPSVREKSAMALGVLRDPSTVPDLTAALGDPAASVRRETALALGFAGTGDERVIAALRGHLREDPSQGVRGAAARSLTRQDKGVKSCVSHFGFLVPYIPMFLRYLLVYH